MFFKRKKVERVEYPPRPKTGGILGLLNGSEEYDKWWASLNDKQRNQYMHDLIKGEVK